MVGRPRAKSAPMKAKSKVVLPPSLVDYQEYEVSVADLARLVGRSVDKNGPNLIPVLAKAKPDAGTRRYRLVVTGDDSTSVVAPAEPIAHDAFDAGPRARAVLRGREIAVQDLKDSGGTYKLAEVQVLLNDVSRQRVDQMVKAGKLLVLPGPSNSRRYPVVQFHADGTLVDGLKDVQDALPTRNPWAVLNFLIHADDRLQGVRPIELLRQGRVAAVVAAAARMAQPGA
jgi:hypothetical protein